MNELEHPVHIYYVFFFHFYEIIIFTNFPAVNTLMIAKPDKGRQVEAAIIQMAQTGQIGGRLSEEELIGLLERFAGSTKKTAVKFDRRRNALDSDEED